MAQNSWPSNKPMSWSRAWRWMNTCAKAVYQEIIVPERIVLTELFAGKEGDTVESMPGEADNGEVMNRRVIHHCQQRPHGEFQLPCSSSQALC